MGGFMLSEHGKPEAALRFYRQALSFNPSLVVAHVNSGKLLFDARRFAEALAAFEAATAIAPDDADAWCSRAGALRELGRLEESLEAARRALLLRPHFAEAAINLGNALLKLDRMDEALFAYRRASAARPGFAAALCGEALALRNLGRIDEAFAAFEAAESLGSREAIAGKGCLLLTLGDFERGFEGYEARWLEGKSLPEALGTRFSHLAGARAARRARPCAQRSRSGRHDPILSLPASNGKRGGGCDICLPREIAPSPLVRREGPFCRRASGA
jgi:tetratricopeptide (TPR) repeat protein